MGYMSAERADDRAGKLDSATLARSQIDLLFHFGALSLIPAIPARTKHQFTLRRETSVHAAALEHARAHRVQSELILSLGSYG